MKFLVTACLFSERLKPHPKPGVREFFEKSEIAVPFATFLTIERGLDILAMKDAEKEVTFRAQTVTLLSQCEIVNGDTAEMARAMARILGHGPLRHMWLPNQKAKEPSFGHYPWIAATSMITGIPIATIKTRDLAAVGSYFELPGLYDPVNKEWLDPELHSKTFRHETPILPGVSPEH